MELKSKEFKEHISGLFVANDGEVYVPKSGVHGEHFTYGYIGKHTQGYCIVVYKRKNYKIHRLVGECWIENPDNKPFIDHINRVRNDNRVENLRWATRKENQNNVTEYKHTQNVKGSKVVLQLDLKGNIIREWPSTAECGRNGFIQQHVCRCCNGKQHTHNGYVWKYKKEGD